LRVGKFAIDDVQIRPADAAGGHRDAHLTRAGLPIRQFGPRERCFDLVVMLLQLMRHLDPLETMACDCRMT
jgi:hypothetical protein